MGARWDADGVIAHPQAPAKLGERVGQNPGRPTTESRCDGSSAKAGRCRVGRASFNLAHEKEEG